MLGSSEISDANDKQGSLEVTPINYGHHITGKCFYIPAFGNSNWHVHKRAEMTPKLSVVVIVGIMTDDNAIIGELVIRYLIEKKHAKGVVVLGKVRDIPAIRKYNWPIWCKGTTPIGAINTQEDPTPDQMAISSYWENTLNETNVVCDDTGAVYFKKFLSPEKIRHIKEKEILWKQQLDSGMSTFQIVCK